MIEKRNSPENQLSSEWRGAQIMYPLYVALAREFVIDLPACSALESGETEPSPELMELARPWFLEMDQRIQVHQLRQFLQTTALSSEEGLRALLEHHLHKAERSPADRDKIDFLLAQFFSHGVPSPLETTDVDLQYVSRALEPLLGTVELKPPAFLRPLDEFVRAANHCHSLNELLTSGILEKGRKLKLSAGDNYFQPIAMVAFTRFSFLMRRIFFRLMHQDLNAIIDGLRELELSGVSTLDCRSAQFSGDEPILRLRMICQSWRVMFHAEYSSGQPLRMLVDLRNVVDAALRRINQKTSAAPAPRAKAAAAASQASSAPASAPASNVPEFEVTRAPAEWDPEGSTGSDHDSESSKS
jgi:hypothetical protein